jgi:hypothetical protein
VREARAAQKECNKTCGQEGKQKYHPFQQKQLTAMSGITAGECWRAPVSVGKCAQP